MAIRMTRSYREGNAAHLVAVAIAFGATAVFIGALLCHFTR